MKMLEAEIIKQTEMTENGRQEYFIKPNYALKTNEKNKYLNNLPWTILCTLLKIEYGL